MDKAKAARRIRLALDSHGHLKLAGDANRGVVKSGGLSELYKLADDLVGDEALDKAKFDQAVDDRIQALSKDANVVSLSGFERAVRAYGKLLPNTKSIVLSEAIGNLRRWYLNAERAMMQRDGTCRETLIGLASVCQKIADNRYKE